MTKQQNNYPKRKHPRLDNYDYSSAGAYFITICTENRRCILSRVVGRGLAPAATSAQKSQNGESIFEQFKSVDYTKYGQIAEKQLLLLEDRYPFLEVDHYVIMPNHIHAVLILNNKTAGASPRPTIMDIVCVYKSLTTIECKKNGLSQKLFQTSFFEHVVRDRKDYNEIIKYIYENPIRWYYDELYSEKLNTY